jgi:hypothetical protein
MKSFESLRRVIALPLIVAAAALGPARLVLDARLDSFPGARLEPQDGRRTESGHDHRLCALLSLTPGMPALATAANLVPSLVAAPVPACSFRQALGDGQRAPLPRSPPVLG